MYIVMTKVKIISFVLKHMTPGNNHLFNDH